MASLARKLVPILDKVLLEKVAAETTQGGVLLPVKLRSTSKECETARVVAVGNGKYTKSGKLIPMSVKEGDVVLLPDRSGTFVKLFGREFVIYEESDLLGVLDE